MIRLKSLNQLRGLRMLVTDARRRWLVHRHGIEINPTASLSLSARMIARNGGRICIGAETLLAFKTLLLADAAPGPRGGSIIIGRRCFIGGGAMIVSGVSVGDGSIIAAGAVVRRDVPAHSIVAGNPARIIRQGISVGKFGRLDGADDNSRRMWRP